MGDSNEGKRHVGGGTIRITPDQQVADDHMILIDHQGVRRLWPVGVFYQSHIEDLHVLHSMYGIDIQEVRVSPQNLERYEQLARGRERIVLACHPPEILVRDE